MFKRMAQLLTATRRRAIASGAALFSLVALTDHAAPDEVALEAFYFLPLFVLTWFAGRRWGASAAAAAIGVWLADEGADFYGHWHVLLWNALVKLAFFCAVVLLVDRLRGAAQKARAASEVKSMMLHTVSHEFNNALTGLSAGLYLLREGDAGAARDPLKKKLYGAMDAAYANLRLYVKNILNEARLRGGRFTPEMTPSTVSGLTAGPLGAVAGLMEEKGLSFSLETPDGPLTVEADRELMSLVISNLLGNAVKYTPAGGSITVRAGLSPETPGKARISVEDTGMGIPPEERERITDAFYRGETGRRAADGFGLGLSLTRELLELHDSKLMVDCGEAKGTRFWFELPVRAAPPEIKARDGAMEEK
ncbi:MAG: HAMP domain-containing sensor histidine kinase [Elusimicrobia bacterium]|nr:HAMP domain-containing sensor histidine kinase [Elusimicrobiota bacterium]